MVEWLKTEFQGSSCLDLSNTDYKCILYHAWFLTWVPGIELRSSCMWKICISDWASPQLHIRRLVHLHTCSVCLHECSCVHVCILIRTSMCRPEVDVRCHPQSLCTSLLIQSLFLAVNSLVPLDGLVTWFQVLRLPSQQLDCVRMPPCTAFSVGSDNASSLACTAPLSSLSHGPASG